MSLILLMQTASRLTWSFARDNALLGSRYIGHIHPILEVPVWALVVNGAVIFIIGCIYLGSTTAFNAFIGTGLILQQITYAIPAAVLLYGKRSSHLLPTNRPFKLWDSVGWIANFFTVGFAIIVVVFYNLPVVMPVEASNMSECRASSQISSALTDTLFELTDYTSAVIGVMTIFAGLNWFIWARTKYHGPRLHQS